MRVARFNREGGDTEIELRELKQGDWFRFCPVNTDAFRSIVWQAEADAFRVNSSQGDYWMVRAMDRSIKIFSAAIEKCGYEFSEVDEAIRTCTLDKGHRGPHGGWEKQ
jgi:hypothetical protein